LKIGISTFVVHVRAERVDSFYDRLIHNFRVRVAVFKEDINLSLKSKSYSC
jgi:hypothetical protein